MDGGPAVMASPGRVLHVGCGGAPLPSWLAGFEETRLDIDPASNPDIVGDMTDLGDIGAYDAIYCPHALEHIHGHQVAGTLAGFFRALRPDGHLLIFVPDLEDVAPTNEVLFVSPAGPVTGLDLFYGKQDMIEDRPYMAHHTGFTAATLRTAMIGAGFHPVEVRRVTTYNLFGVGVKP